MSSPRPIRLLPAAIGLMLYQIVLALFLAGGRPARLVFWDATWYRDIAALGYQVELPLVHHAEGGSNIAFFPAFPLWVRGILHALPVSPDMAVLIASWIACAAIWAYLVVLLRRLGVRPGWSWVALIAFLVQPGTFYAVAGYSEPLFTAALLGYIHWSTRAIEENKSHALSFALAVLHGAILSSTRILGVALCAYPLLLALARSLPRPRLPDVWAPALLGVLSLSGFAAFLAYCAIRWGRWDLYWEANRIGWNVYFDPWKLLTPSYYTDVFFVGNLSEVLGRLFTVATLVVSVALTRWAWKVRARDALPLALAVLNLGFMLETIVGSHGMHSMIRYLIPIHALVIPCAARWAQDRGDREPGQWPSLGLSVAGALITIWLLAVQVMFLIRYSRNEWVS